MLVPCPICNVARELKRDRKAPCRNCSNGSGKESPFSKTTFLHTCERCSEQWVTKSRTSSKWCHECVPIIMSEKKTKDVCKNDYTCKKCNKFVKSKNPRKTGICKSCILSNKKVKVEKPKKEKKKYDRTNWTSYQNQLTLKKIEAEKRRNQKYREQLEREAQMKEEKPREMTWEQQQELIAEFYKKNKVVHYDIVETWGMTTCQRSGSIDVTY